MENYSYISGAKKMIIGGEVIASSDISQLSEAQIKELLNRKIIKADGKDNREGVEPREVQTKKSGKRKKK